MADGAVEALRAFRAVLVVASDQEHRLAAINATLPADRLQPPWILTKVVVFGRH